jgi:hypothetical protein
LVGDRLIQLGDLQSIRSYIQYLKHPLVLVRGRIDRKSIEVIHFLEDYLAMASGEVVSKEHIDEWGKIIEEKVYIPHIHSAMITMYQAYEAKQLSENKKENP